MGFVLPDSTVALWEARLQRFDDSHGERLRTIHEQMAAQMGGDVWGATPGGPSKLMAELLEQSNSEPISPTFDGLSTMELQLIQRDRDGIGWIEPMLFQGLCDFIGVVLASALEIDWQWAVCEERSDGLYPPPHYRVPLRSLREGQARWAGSADQVPVALHILRAHVMPASSGETSPTLASWLRALVGA